MKSNYKERLYLSSPFLIKRLLANAEAIKRNHYRHASDYNTLLKSYMESNPLIDGIPDVEILDRLKTLLAYVKKNTVFYRDYLCDLSDVSELSQMPLLRKEDIRNNRETLKVDKVSSGTLLMGVTSGSTGTPVSFYTDKKSLTHSRAYLDSFKHLHGITNKTKTARLSGIKVVPLEQKDPPFWLYIDIFRQLQCSVLHIDRNTVSSYIDAFTNYGIKHGNGYASGWLFLAQAAIEANTALPQFDTIITDSEGLTPDEHDFLERAFRCRVFQTYGLGEVDDVAIMCQARNYHIMQGHCIVEIVDDSGQPLPDGCEGNIVVTDLDSYNFPFIRYETGDIGVRSRNPCVCGWKSPYLTSIVGRVDDYLLKSDGRKIGRLSHIMKPAKGVLKSQLVQTDYDALHIRVVADEGFRSETMNDVIDNARTYIGNMNITWELTDQLERTSSGKIKYVIRRFNRII